MTQPVNDPWAAASPVTHSAAPAAPQQTQPATDAGLAGAFGGDEGGSLLFGGGGAAPSLMNKTHLMGTARGGIITKMENKQDQDFNARAPKYFSLSRVGGEQKNRATTTDAIDGPTGLPNKPVMVTHISLSTEYRMDQAEAVATARDGKPRDISTDDGTRVEVVGGLDLPAFSQAIADAKSRGIRLAGPSDLIGKRLTVKRAGQKPNPGGNPSWIKAYHIDNA